MFNLILLFVYICCVGFLFMLYFTLKKEPNEATRQEFIDVNDIPDWQPLNPIAKRSNQALKKMYKGKMRGELV
jgi:hypothetical protein